MLQMISPLHAFTKVKNLFNKCLVSTEPYELFEIVSDFAKCQVIITGNPKEEPRKVLGNPRNRHPCTFPGDVLPRKH